MVRHWKFSIAVLVLAGFCVPTSLQAKPKTRYVKVIVKDNHNNPLNGATITVYDRDTKEPLKGQVYKTGEQGTKGIVVMSKPEVELVVGYPGLAEERQAVYWSNQYEFKLAPPLQTSAVTFTTPVQVIERVVEVVPVKKTRTVSVVVEGSEGKRLRDAEVAVLDVRTKKILERKLLVEGLGSVEFESEAGITLEVVATAPGRLSNSLKVGEGNNYIFKLPRREMQARGTATVKDTSGALLQGAQIVVTEAGRVLARATANAQGLTSFAYAYTDPGALNVEATKDGYKSATTPLSPRASGVTLSLEPTVKVVDRTLGITVQATDGGPIAQADVSVVDAVSNKLYERVLLQKGIGSVRYKTLENASVKLLAAAANHRNTAAAVTEAATYVLKLEPLVKTVQRTLSLIVQTPDGVPLPQAEVSLVDEANKIYERVLLPQGVGTIRYKAKEDVALKLVASASGRLSSSAALGEPESYTFKLERKQLKSKVAVTVKDNVGRQVAGATVLVTEEGRQLASVTTNDRGWAEVNYAYSNASLVLLETHHGGYNTRKAPLNPTRDSALEVVLLPARREVKPSIYTVIVLSKAFTSSPKNMTRVRQAVNRLLTDSQKSPDLWLSTAVMTIGDGRIREILPVTSKVNEGDVKQAMTRLSGLYGQAGTLSWRDLKKLSDFLKNSKKVGEAGADLLVIAPKNTAMDETLNLYEAGGDGVMDAFRQNNLRLRLIEVGFTDDPTKAYKELCDKTQGFYKALIIDDKLAEQVAGLQYHYPTPPPQ